MATKPEEDGPILKAKYAFYTDSSQELNTDFIGHFDSDEAALEYAKKEGFAGCRKILLVIDYPLTEKNGIQIANNLNKFQNETDKLFSELKNSFTPQQLDTFYRLLCYTFHNV